MAKKNAPPPEPPLALTGDLDVFGIHDQWERILGRIEAQAGPLVVDLSGAGDLDLSGLQVLLAARRALAEKGHSLTLEGAPAAWVEHLGSMGWSELLGGAGA